MWCETASCNIVPGIPIISSWVIFVCRAEGNTTLLVAGKYIFQVVLLLELIRLQQRQIVTTVNTAPHSPRVQLHYAIIQIS